MRFSFGAAVALGLAWAPVVYAQSVLSGELGGTVTASGGRVLPNVAITLRSGETGLIREATSALDGGFTFDLVPPGIYEVRAEAIGYRPLVVMGARVDAGGYRSLDLVMTAAAPPVVEVDTLRLVTGGTRWTAHGPHAGSGDLASFREVGGSLSILAALSPDLDAQNGALGLPGALTQHVVDGVPFYRATHPTLRGDDGGSPALPASFLSRGGIGRRATDIEFLLAPGATLDIETKAGPQGGAFALEGGWSGAALWSSGLLDVSSPELSSFRALAEGVLDLIPDTSRLYLAAEASSHEAPLQPRVPERLGAGLTAFDQETRDLLLLPSIEKVARYSGLARLDRWGPTSRLTLRASGGRLERSYSHAPPGWLDYGTAVPEETTEVSSGVAFSTAINPRTSLEFLGGVSVSDRVFGWTGESPWAPAFLAGPGLPIGPATGSAAEASRLDAFASTSVQFPLGDGAVRGGVSFHAARHTLAYGYAGGGDLAFSDLAAAVDGSGAYRAGTSTETSFSLPRLGAFAQYSWRPSPGVQIQVGARLDYETLPTNELRLNEEWLTATGVRNDDFPTKFNLPGGHFSATWDVTGTGATLLTAGGAVSHGSFEPALLHEAFVNDGAATVRRAVGPGMDWPSAEPPSGARREEILTLLGPDTRPMRTVTVGGGLTQSLGAGWTFHLSGTARNTDFIARRRDLNLPIFPLATDPWERELRGDLRKVGAVVAPEAGSNRRFAGFDAVWAIDPDGWSRYWGATLGLGYAGEATDLWVAYTRSETRDNWVGAGAGLADAQLDPGLPGEAGTSWAEAVSDFDSPHRLVAGARTRVDLGGAEAEVSVVYSRRSGLPFTPRYRVGVDANGDGSFRNDVAFVPGGGELGDLLGSWPCLADQTGAFAERNSCRGPDRSSLNASVRLGLATVGGSRVWLTVEGFNLIEDEGGIVDEALLLVDPGAGLTRSAGNGQVSIPVTVNPGFGEVIFPASRGRMLRVGLRVGG